MAYTISRSSWHFRLYRFYLTLKKMTSDGYCGEPCQICLCPYMRTLLIWLPLRLALTVGVVGGFLFLIGSLAYLAFIGIREIGFVTFLIIVGKAIGVIAAIVGTVWCVVKVALKIQSAQYSDYQPKTIVGQWMKANHEKICPCFEVTE